MSFLSKARYVEQSTHPGSPIRHHVMAIEHMAERLAGGLRLEMNKPLSKPGKGQLSIAGVRSVASLPDPVDPCLLVTFIGEDAFSAALDATSWPVSPHAPLTLEARMVIGSIYVPSMEGHFLDWSLVVPGADEIWS